MVQPKCHWRYSSIEANIIKHADILGFNSINKVGPKEQATEHKLLPDEKRSEYQSTNMYESVAHNKNPSISSNRGEEDLVFKKIYPVGIMSDAERFQ